jgi:hypothetical protein
MSDIGYWKTKPEAQKFDAAADYLGLLLQAREVTRMVAALKKAPTVHKKAKDLLRASRLPLLPPTNRIVASHLKKIGKGGRLSPVLLVRGNMRASAALTVADGYHRICASYELNENTDIPCRIVDL